jgi:hypothetical protein
MLDDHRRQEAVSPKIHAGLELYTTIGLDE